MHARIRTYFSTLEHSSPPNSPAPPPHLSCVTLSTFDVSTQTPSYTPTPTGSMRFCKSHGVFAFGARSSTLSPAPPRAALLRSYMPKVSFDMSENPAVSMFSLTLQAKAAGYRRTRNARVFFVRVERGRLGERARSARAGRRRAHRLPRRGRQCLWYVRPSPHTTLVLTCPFGTREKPSPRASCAAHGLQHDTQAVSRPRVHPDGVTDTIDRLTALYLSDSLVVGTRRRRLGALVQELSMAGIGGVGPGTVRLFFLSLFSPGGSELKMCRM